MQTALWTVLQVLFGYVHGFCPPKNWANLIFTTSIKCWKNAASKTAANTQMEESDNRTSVSIKDIWYDQSKCKGIAKEQEVWKVQI
jgi:hypothetical protein